MDTSGIESIGGENDKVDLRRVESIDSNYCNATDTSPLDLKKVESIEVSVNYGPNETIPFSNNMEQLQEGDESDSMNDPEKQDYSIGLKHRHAANHFSLRKPGSEVVLGKKNVQVFQQKSSSQFVIENDGENVTAKNTKDGSCGLMILRAFYSLIALLMSGFLFVFCIQVILHLFLGLAIDSGLTSQNGFKILPFIGTLLSIPVYVYGLASTMCIASTFVNDTWSGSRFMKSIGGYKYVSVEWFTFIIFMAVPFGVGSASLFAQLDIWWEVTALTWISCVLLNYIIFAAAIIYYEIVGCLELVRFNPSLSRRGAGASDKSGIFSFGVLLRAILLRQQQKLGLQKHITYVMKDDGNPENMESSKFFYKEHLGIVTRILFSFPFIKIGLYKKLETPIRVYNIDEVLDRAPFQTSKTWSLEKLYCVSRNTRVVAVIGGPEGLLPNQVMSSFACSLIGFCFPIILTSAFLTWFDVSTILIYIVGAIIGLYSLNSLRTSVQLFKLWRSIKTSRKDGDVTMYQVKESVQVAEANPIFCWVLLLFETMAFFAAPTFILFYTQNTRVAIVFVVIGVISGFRQYLNVGNCLKKMGSLDGLEANNLHLNDDTTDDWAEKNRLSMIVTKVSQGRRRDVWIEVFSVFVFICCAIFLSAVTFGSNEGAVDLDKPLNDFKYPGNKRLTYPTCRMGKLSETPGESRSALADYVFLSAIAYRAPNVTQILLNDWFGEEVAYDRQDDTVSDFQDSYQLQNGKTSVTYKLIDFPLSELSVVTIRGTKNGWDALADAQLWSAAAFAQQVRALLPLGEIWTPVMEYLIWVISIIESESIKEVSYYKETTSFVESLKAAGNNIQIMGHSLGGGLAMITGAQTDSPAVAVSGPNNKLSRRTFDPPLTNEQIDTLLFNIIPDRDPVPRFDDPGQLYQRIQCTAPLNNPLDCHDVERSLCEVLFACGSFSRPVYCFCHDKFGYDKPEPTGERTYEEACPTTVPS